MNRINKKASVNGLTWLSKPWFLLVWMQELGPIACSACQNKKQPKNHKTKQNQNTKTTTKTLKKEEKKKKKKKR